MIKIMVLHEAEPQSCSQPAGHPAPHAPLSASPGNGEPRGGMPASRSGPGRMVKLGAWSQPARP